MPRSVMMPVTKRLCVTSNAGLATATSGAAIWTVRVSPSLPTPLTTRSSLAARFSMGISRFPSLSVQSMVEDGAAT